MYLNVIIDKQVYTYTGKFNTSKGRLEVNGIVLELNRETAHTFIEGVILDEYPSAKDINIQLFPVNNEVLKNIGNIAKVKGLID